MQYVVRVNAIRYKSMKGERFSSEENDVVQREFYVENGWYFFARKVH
jgi:hypothetical protein